MKRILLFIAAIAVSGIAAPTAYPLEATTEAPVVTLTGYVIDNSCARTNIKNLDEVCLTYTSECALKEECIKSGYSFYSVDGKVIPFNEASNKKVEEFLRMPGSKTRVTIKAGINGDKLDLISIENYNASNE